MSGFRLTNDQDYRRGMILGLTLAEMLILLVFLLLLSAAALLEHREREVASLTTDLGKLKSEMVPVETALRKQGVSIVDADNVAALLERGRRAQQIEQALQATRAELAVALQRASAAETALTATRSNLAQTQSRLQTLSHDQVTLAGQLSQTAGDAEQGDRGARPDRHHPPVVARRRSGPAGAAAAQLRRPVPPGNERAGAAERQWRAGPAVLLGGYPRGDPLYMLRITLHGSTAQDVTVSAVDVAPRPKPDSPAWGLINDLPRDHAMPLSALIGGVGALKRRAEELKCRYAVEVIDATAASNKAGYKEAMNRLWGVFYLRELH